jgi:hypothetical protein
MPPQGRLKTRLANAATGMLEFPILLAHRSRNSVDPDYRINRGAPIARRV